MLKVSVIIPVYNVESYLAECLDSVINQTLEDIEILCIDDGSKDKSSEILREYSKKDKRIIIIRQANAGPGAARNNGMKIAEGEYIYFMDADDKILPETLEDTYNKTKKDDLELVFFKLHAFYDSNNKPVHSYNDNYYSLTMFPKDLDNKVFNFKDTKDFIFNIPVSPCNKLYKKDFLDRIEAKFPEGLYFEDNVFFFKVFLNAKRVAIIRKSYYLRRMRDKSITTTYSKELFDFFEILELVKEEFIKNDDLKVFKAQFYDFHISLLVSKFMLIDYENQKKFFEMLKETVFHCLNEYDLNKLDKKSLSYINNIIYSKTSTILKFLLANNIDYLETKTFDSIKMLKLKIRYIIFSFKEKHRLN